MSPMTIYITPQSLPPDDTSFLHRLLLLGYTIVMLPDEDRIGIPPA